MIFSKVLMSSFDFFRPFPFPLWQPTQLLTRIGATSRENFSPESSVAGAGSVLAAGASVASAGSAFFAAFLAGFFLATRMICHVPSGRVHSFP